ncbi:MAG TPA: Ig-like domain-containing protein, partial [Woeseiaceae bacterium]
DGTISGDIQWESSLDGMLDTGASITEMLSLGQHTITAYVTDSGGLPGSASINVEVTPPPLAPSAFIQINAGQGIDASTFGNNSFVITNTGETEITSFSLDLSTTFMPDIVYDPVGSAGDVLGKCLTPGTGTAATGFVAPANACTDPFSQPHDGDPADGYDVISMSFTDFDPGESFAFSVDIDPTSIKNDVTTGDAGSISGFELIGATASVTFGSAGTIDASLRDEGTLGGSAAVVALNAPATPSIQLAGIATPAAVASPAQTVTITGPANSPFVLLQVDARLYIDAGAPGGGYDIDPFEANQALAKVLIAGTIGASGSVNVPVTLLQTPQGTGPDGGLNHFIAWVPGVLVDGEVQTSLTSNTIVVEFDPPLPNTAPVVTITAPADASSFDDTDLIDFSGNAIDDHDGDLSSQIEWTSSLDGSLGTGASINTSLSGGTHTITAQVMDSGSLVGTDTITVNVSGNAAPVVTITAPADGAMFDPGETITFIGSANDAEDGNLTAALSWTSDLDGPLGTGGEISDVLSDGTHVVTASVTDNGGLTRSQQITVSVAPPPQPSALIQVNPGGGLAASTFTSNSFIITNTGDADITSVSFDLSSAFLPDVVFDP